MAEARKNINILTQKERQMSAKLRIDLTQRIVEVEGSEDLVGRIYSDFKDQIAQLAVRQTGATGKSTPAQSKPRGVISQPKRKAKGGRKESHAIAPDLDLSKKGNKLGLKEFYTLYSPKSNMERNLLFVYYLKNVQNTPNIEVDYIFTCYRNLAVKVPEALEQSLLDTKNRKGWIDTSDLNDIGITTAGINYVEHDMKKAGEESE